MVIGAPPDPTPILIAEANPPIVNVLTPSMRKSWPAKSEVVDANDPIEIGVMYAPPFTDTLKSRLGLTLVPLLGVDCTRQSTMLSAGVPLVFHACAMKCNAGHCCTGTNAVESV